MDEGVSASESMQTLRAEMEAEREALRAAHPVEAAVLDEADLACQAAVAARHSAITDAREAVEEGVRRFYRELPSLVDRAAKKVAINGHSISTSLGPDGLQQMRAELATSADSVVAGLNPAPWTRFEADDLDAMLDTVVNAVTRRVNPDRLADVLDRYGYRSRGAIAPQELVDRAIFVPVAVALMEQQESSRRLAEAEAARREAQAAAGRAVAEGMWGS